jgi:UDP-N-acetylglucosamine acyltransferase
VIEGGVQVGVGCEIASHVVLRTGTRLGDGVRVDSFSVLGGDPQSIGFDRSIESGVHVGDRVVFREACTVHRSMYTGKATIIGSDCFLMAQAHVAHDCELGDAVIAANAVLLGGHAQVGERCFLGGGSGVHQFCRIGAYAILAGHALMTVDVPPACMAAGRNAVHGLNLVGLRRAKIGAEAIQDLKACFHAVYKGGGNYKAKSKAVIEEGQLGLSPMGQAFLEFFEMGKRGFACPQNNEK